MRVTTNTPVQGSTAVVRQSQDPTVGADARHAANGRDTQDSVVISPAGMARAAAAGYALSPERAADLRQAILDGKFDSVEILGNTARRILDRGDA